jgi:hypothetical protein
MWSLADFFSVRSSLGIERAERNRTPLNMHGCR